MRAAPIVAAANFLFTSGCAQPQASPTSAAPDAETNDAALKPLENVFSGTALGSPVAPFNATHAFDVPAGAVGVNATLRWNDPAARFTLRLIDPRGEVAATGYPPSPGTLIVATVEPPRAGSWKLEVASTLAANVAYDLKAVTELIVPAHNALSRTLTLNPRSFYEVNLILEGNASFDFWINASQPVAWDVHSHPEGGVKEWQKGNDATIASRFTAPERGIYSVLVETGAQTPTTLDLAVDGRFRVHSHG